jgi:hypothetical protein
VSTIHDLDRVITSDPIDRTAAMVTRKGVSYDPAKRITQRHWDCPPQMKPVPHGCENRIGTRFGRMEVVGYFCRSKKKGSIWVVRCACGKYETRTTKSIVNKNNDTDCCQICRHVLYLKRESRHAQTGEWAEWREL